MSAQHPREDRAFCAFMVAVLGNFPVAIVGEIPLGSAVADAYSRVAGLTAAYRQEAA